jgi:hypothetical protein
MFVLSVLSLITITSISDMWYAQDRLVSASCLKGLKYVFVADSVF